MLRFWITVTAVIAAAAFIGWAQEGPYKVQKTAKVGGAGGFDYVYADEAGRRLYIARTGPTPRITVFDLDSLEPAGEIPNTSAHGAAVSPKSNHGFGSSKPIAMLNSKTLAPIKTIAQEGNPHVLLLEPSKGQVWDLSTPVPNNTVLTAA